LILSYVPDTEQRLWRNLTRAKVRLREDRSRVQDQVEGLLEEMMIKLSSVVSNLFGVIGVSGRRILKALATGEDDPVQHASLGDSQLKVNREDLQEALRGRVRSAHRILLGLYLQQVELIDQQIAVLEREISYTLRPYQATIERLADLPGVGVDSAHQIIAEPGRRRPLSLRLGKSPPGWGSVQDETRVPASRTTIGRRKAIGPCDVYSTNSLGQRSAPKAAIFKTYFDA
jgi:transposase